MTRYLGLGVYSQIVSHVFHPGHGTFPISPSLQRSALQKESRVPHHGILSWFCFVKMGSFLVRSESCDL